MFDKIGRFFKGMLGKHMCQDNEQAENAMKTYQFSESIQNARYLVLDWEKLERKDDGFENNSDDDIGPDELLVNLHFMTMGQVARKQNKLFKKKFMY
jgi:hypothetical protein